jgi:hypothetical protein
LEKFFKSRVDYVIENTLKYIELKDLLDHIVKHDEEIKFHELSDMIGSIFRENSSDIVVLINAYRTANK